MNNILHRIFAAFIALTIIAGCSSKEEQPAPCVEVNVLFSNEGFCGFGYNDAILKALEKVSGQYGFDYSFFVPDSLEHGMNHYRQWLEKDIKEGVKKSLYIFASDTYAELLDKEKHPAADSRKEILIFEVEKELPYAYTFAMSYYGASYLTSLHNTQSLINTTLADNLKYYVIAANPYISGVDYVLDGIQASIDETGYGALKRINISIFPYGGLNMQNIAYMYCILEDMEDPDSHKVFYPLAGNSNMGVYRYTQLHYKMSIGVDSDEFKSPFILFSMVKRMDLALDDFFRLWMKDKEIPRHVFYTMESGRVDVTFDDTLEYSQEKKDSLKNIAIKKEKEYFKARKDR